MARTAWFLVALCLVASAGETEQLKRDIAGLEFLNRLDLSQEQARALLPIAVDGAMLPADEPTRARRPTKTLPKRTASRTGSRSTRVPTGTGTSA